MILEKETDESLSDSNYGDSVNIDSSGGAVENDMSCVYTNKLMSYGSD
jgi:hypothetical protein